MSGYLKQYMQQKNTWAAYIVYGAKNNFSSHDWLHMFIW
jgi:hypothetical protein